MGWIVAAVCASIVWGIVGIAFVVGITQKVIDKPITPVIKAIPTDSPTPSNSLETYVK